MKKIRLGVMVIASLFALAACDNTTEDTSMVNTSTITTESNPIQTTTQTQTKQTSSTTTTQEDKLDFDFNVLAPSFDTPVRNSKDEFIYDDVFNLGNKVAINVEISQGELNKLNDDYYTGAKSEIYRVADKVTISITNNNKEYVWEYENVGIRQKGNTSRQSILINNEINNQNHFKLSFDETFDDASMYPSNFISVMKEKMNGEDYSDRDFLGLSGLDIKWNKNYDLTHIKEIYASYLYKACGVMTQHIGLTTFKMKDTDYDTEADFGLCELYEAATKSLVKRALQSDTSYIGMSSWKEEKKGSYGIADVNYGDLYKCSYGAGAGSNGGACLSMYSIDEVRVGVGDIYGYYIPGYERKTNTGVDYDDSQFKNIVSIINNKTINEIKEVVDLEYLMAEEAASYFVGNPDAMRYNYNNYLVYIRRTDGKMIIIPYDSDRCFGITKDWNIMNGMTETELLSNLDCNGHENKNELLNKVLFTSGQYQNLYIEMCNIIAESDWVKTETFYRYYDMARESYNTYSFKKDDTNIRFDQYITSKLNSISSQQGTGEYIYSNLYIVGNFNNWGSYSSKKLDQYNFKRIAPYTYQIKITIDSDLENNQLAVKINNGYGSYEDIDWTFSSDLTKLIKSIDHSVKIDGVNKGDTYTITINVNTCVATFEKNK